MSYRTESLRKLAKLLQKNDLGFKADDVETWTLMLEAFPEDYATNNESLLMLGEMLEPIRVALPKSNRGRAVNEIVVVVNTIIAGIEFLRAKKQFGDEILLQYVRDDMWAAPESLKETLRNEVAAAKFISIMTQSLQYCDNRSCDFCGETCYGSQEAHNKIGDYSMTLVVHPEDDELGLCGAFIEMEYNNIPIVLDVCGDCRKKCQHHQKKVYSTTTYKYIQTNGYIQGVLASGAKFSLDKAN